jgi:glucosamine kinase
VTHTYFIGVDGGATKCTVLLQDAAGNTIGHASSGPANIRISVPQAWQSIHHALQNILHTSTVTLNAADCQTHVGVGIAGCEIDSAYQSFIHHPHSFTSLAVTNDAHTACLGAHNGRDGALIIAGTGVVGYQIEGSRTEKVSGWGFPHDDLGSGAWLGLEAVKVAVQWRDGRLPASALAEAVYAHFDHQLNDMIDWANQANSTAFAELAPIVIKMQQAGDTTAERLLQQAARFLDAVAAALLAKQQVHQQPLPCSLVGGVSCFLQPYLSAELQARLVACDLPPEAGAILFAQQQLAMSKEK